jgi:hypothetical protein
MGFKEYNQMHGRYHFLVVFMPRGHRNGYIGIPAAEFNQLISERPDFMENLNVHGGVTYEGGSLSVLGKEGFNYVGFDCNHFGDKVDVQSMIQYNMDLNILKAMNDGFYEEKMSGLVKTKEFVLEELQGMIQEIFDPEGIIASYCIKNNHHKVYEKVLTRDLDEEDVPQDLLLFMELNNIKY